MIFSVSPISDIPESDDTGVYIKDDCVFLNWGGCEYWFPMDRLSTPDAVLGFLAHVGEKEWGGMIGWNVRDFIIQVYNYNGWGFPCGD